MHPEVDLRLRRRNKLLVQIYGIIYIYLRSGRELELAARCVRRARAGTNVDKSCRALYYAECQGEVGQGGWIPPDVS